MQTAALTATDLLQVGSWFLRDGRLFQIHQWEPAQPLQIEARAADTGDVYPFTLTELFAPDPPTQFAATAQELVAEADTGETTVAPIIDANTLPAHLRQRADYIIQTVTAVQTHIAQLQRDASPPLSQTEATQRACQMLPQPIASSTYYRYRRLYQTHRGDRGCIAAALRRSTYGKSKIDANAQHFIDTLIRRFYRSNPPLRAQTVYYIAQQLWHHNQRWWLNFTQTGSEGMAELIEQLLDARQDIHNLLADPEQKACLVQIPLPSRSWFYGYARWFTAQPGAGKQVYTTRYGLADWEANFLIFDRFAATATLPLQYVFADHYKLDILHVDDEFRETLDRLWLTLLIDAYSRAVLGIYLAYEDPNVESIQGALRHAIWPKTGLKSFDITQTWACFGIPQRLSLDNAWAHHSYSLEELARALAGGGQYTTMELIFRPPYQARYGGLVERLFGNLAAQLRERLPGAMLQPDQRHWHNASQGACLLYQDVEKIIHQLVVDYLHTPHRELGGLTPHEKWLAGLQLMTPVPPPLTTHLARCFWRLYPETRAATHMGLGLLGMHYWDVSLNDLRRPDRQGRRRRFHLRYDPTDVSRVAVFENGLWLGDAYARELRLADGCYEPVSLWELQIAKTVARQQQQGRLPRPHSWLIHLLTARELIAQRQTEQKRIRRKVQQVRQRRRGRPRQEQAFDETTTVDAATATATPAGQTVTNGADARDHLLDTFQEVL
ncbi:MAG: DDE-type integrase/transposase/recombinase [bacterium]|nr:DDE-type integrase/transposase/recombinase [bacterium]